MKHIFSNRFVRHYRKLPQTVQGKFDKQLHLLLSNFHHPSLRIKKYAEAQDIWQARVDRSTRFYFYIQGDTYIFLDVKRHPK